MTAANSEQAAKAGCLMRIRIDDEESQLWNADAVWDLDKMLVGYERYAVYLCIYMPAIDRSLD